MVFPINATLTFQLPSGTQTTDALGNPSQALTDYVVQASLKELNRPLRKRTGDDVSTDRHEITLVGRLVNPKALPRAILPGSVATAVVDGNMGTFELEQTVQNRFSQVTEALGEKIHGKFTARILWGEGS